MHTPSVRKSFQMGLSLVEFALVMPVLVLILVAATDFSLAILARQEVHSAARAGIEFAINRGYDVNGIKAAALQSTGSGASRKFATINASGVSVSSAICACYGDISKSVGTPSGTPLSCPTGSATKCPSVSNGPQLLPAPYVSITVTGTYAPIFSGYWWFGLNNGQLNLSAKYVGKTQFLK